MGIVQSAGRTIRFGSRVLAMVAIGAILLVALSMVRHLIDERTERARSVQGGIAVGSQTVRGPVLMLPYTQSTWRRSPEKEWDLVTEEKVVEIRPGELSVEGQMDTELIKRGLYAVPSYSAKLAFKGQLPGEALKPVLALEGRNEEVRVALTWHRPYLSLGLSQSRGIRDLKGQFNGQALKFQPGDAPKGRQAGAHAFLIGTPNELAAALAQAAFTSFDLQLDLAGSQDLQFEPVGEQSHYVLRGDWPHPSFSGNLAPLSRQVDAKGFEVSWKSNPLAVGTGSPCAVDAAVAVAEAVRVDSVSPSAACGPTGASGTVMGVRLFDPVDRYVLVDRTAKYGELFLLLTFGAVFLLEVLRRKEVHPLQYGLVGCALALFFVLTLALSEHISFAKAYGLAALGTIALLSYYTRYMLDDRKTAVGFGLALALLYGILYAVLRAEDVALLVGSLTLFASLTLFMVMTRKVNWFGDASRSTDAQSDIQSDIQSEALPGAHPEADHVGA